jgi:hypothetical protein
MFCFVLSLENMQSQGDFLQMCLCLLPQGGKHLRGGSLDVDLATSCLPWPTRRPPGAAPGRHDASPSSLSLSLAALLLPHSVSLSLTLCSLPVIELHRHGCRLGSPFGAAPCSSEKLRRSPTPPSSSPPKESPRVAAVSPDFSPENRACRRQIRRRRPPSGQTEPTGAPRVSPRSSWTPPPSSSHVAAAAMTVAGEVPGSRSAWAVPS